MTSQKATAVIFKYHVYILFKYLGRRRKMAEKSVITYDRCTDDEVQALLAFYANNEIQRDFESSRRNEKIYLEMSAYLDGLGFHHTARQCREKLKKLKQDYKKLKDHNNRSGANRKVNKWYAQLDAILGHRPAYTSDPGTEDSALQLSTSTEFPTLALDDIGVLTAYPDEILSTGSICIISFTVTVWITE